MKIIIVGAGEIGRHMALSLSLDEHDIVVIERDEFLANEISTQIDARVVKGNGSSVNVLLDANIAECQLFLALTSSNNTNLTCCAMAKKLGASKAICRVHPEVQREEWIFDYKGNFGIDHIFSSERLSAVELVKSIRNPDAVLVEEIARGRIELQQIQVSEHSDAVGRTLKELKLPSRSWIGSITRNEKVIIPTADEHIMSNDLVTIFGEQQRLQDVIERLRKGLPKEKENNIVIFGGGEYGFTLAEMLEGWNCRIRIFEQDPERCQVISNRLENTTILNADATSLSELQEEQVDRADFFIAASPSDEDNVMTCLQANNIGTERCLTLIHRADYADAISASGTLFGIKAAVSPREATRRELMRFVTSDRYHLIRKLDAGEVLEIPVRSGAKVVGKTVSEIQWPEGCGLIAIIHGIHARVPAADDVIDAGDTLYAIVATKAKKALLRMFKA